MGYYSERLIDDPRYGRSYRQGEPVDQGEDGPHIHYRLALRRDFTMPSRHLYFAAGREAREAQRRWRDLGWFGPVQYWHATYNQWVG